MTTPLRVLLVDDEELSRLRLRTLLADCVDPAAQVVGEAATAAAALHWLALHAADVVLLDIRMPGMDGLALAARLRAMPQPPRVIFVTAHAEHALAAFEVEAVDYLTKPVRRLRLQEALARVAQRLGGALPATAPAPLAEPAPAVPVIVVHERGELLRVPLTEVLYLKAEQKYVVARSVEREYLLDESLVQIEDEFPERFLRIHRNCLIARQAVKGVARATTGEDGEAHWVVMLDGVPEQLPVSRRQWPAVKEALGV